MILAKQHKKTFYSFPDAVKLRFNDFAKDTVNKVNGLFDAVESGGGGMSARIDFTNAAPNATVTATKGSMVETATADASGAGSINLPDFGGWTLVSIDDKRELTYIPEVIQYTKTMIEKYPCFWYYAMTINSEFFPVACLIDENYIKLLSVPLVKKHFFETDKEKIISLLNTIAADLYEFGKNINDIDGALESFKTWTNCILGHVN